MAVSVSIPLPRYSVMTKANRIPAINVTRGDTLVMNVHNSLNEPTSLHAHGQFQNGSNYMDGPVGVTQW